MPMRPEAGWVAVLRQEVSRLAAGEGEASRSAAARVDDFVASLPPGYAEATPPAQAARDWVEMAAAGSGQGRFSVAAPGGEGFRLRRAGSSRLELSALVPALESFGLAAVEAAPWHFTGLGPGGAALYVDDIGVRVLSPGASGGFDARASEGRLVGALEAVLAGLAEQSRLNSLVVSAGFDWRQVNLLSAYRAYRHLVGGPRAPEKAGTMLESLVLYPEAAKALVTLFEQRLCSAGEVAPSGMGGALGVGGQPAKKEPAALEGAPAEEEEEARRRALAALSQIPDLAHYEALGELLSLVLATARSNWALGKDTVSFKLVGPEVGFLPLPRPFAEIFVWSPWFFGAHLRFGPVARGGIRWSDRQDELRPEILGLARAQVKKNSLIVPTGAKGGFVLRPPAAPDDETLGRAAYRSFIGALLDLTDNIVGGEVRHPAGILCRDGDDAYLVVAPDKGTASFSDLANEVAAERGYWLGDAFASGGSHGYDHKALGITAKGAWLAVRRHFRALGMDAQRDPIKVVGVGDMSGDVFGNGMLQSKSVRLIAAFDHRHIFVDPAPDPEASFRERQRLQSLPRSSWGDYDLSAAGEGAAVYSRQDKKVELSADASAALGAPPGLLTPPELIRAVLKAPVDLIYFGGVGTFVKDPLEASSLVDDADNDDVRVGADELRARVVAEGANLALTQLARVRYARRGGRVNTDFVDNAAGVAMSDREVNIKILLSLAAEKGLLGEREELLDAAREAAARAVLADVEGSLVALDMAAATSARDLDAWAALLDDLEAAGLLDREVESLPGPEELAKRREAGAGLSRPELAVLIAYARSELARSIERSPLVDDASLLTLAVGYFPAPLSDRFASLVPAHALFHQVVSSQLANEVVATMGGLWAHEAAAEDGRAPWQAAAAYWAAREVLGAASLRDKLDERAWSVPADAELELRFSLAGGLERLSRWYLARGLPAALGAVVERDSLVAGQLAHEGAPSALAGTAVPADLAADVEKLRAQAAAGEIGEVSRSTGRAVAEVAEATGQVEAGLGLDALASALASWAPRGRFERWQLHSLSDGLAQLRANATREAVLVGPGPWLEHRKELAERARTLAARARGQKVPDLALGAVALRACELAAGRDERV